nr:IclR family transcriptional regulator [Sphingomonas sp. CDS-1]
MPRDGRRIQSIEIGFKILRVLERHEGAMPLKDIAAAAEMPASKIHTYLTSFIREKLVKQEPGSGQYSLGPFAFQLGLSAIRQADIIQLSGDEMKALRDLTGQSAYLCVMSSRGPVVATRVDGRYQGALSIQIGFVMPWMSATGFAFLAWMPFHEALEKIAEEGVVVSEADLETSFSHIRARGFATPPVQHVPIPGGFSVISAPVFDHGHQMAGALCMLGPGSMLSDPDMPAKLIASANHLSGQLGGAPPSID